MYEWHQMIQLVMDEIDVQIERRTGDGPTLEALSKKLGYSTYYTTRRFRELAGLSFREYLRLRRLAYALIELRDTEKSILEIGLNYGFSSHEAFTRAFRSAYGVNPKEYRRNPLPLVLRTKINTFDRYVLGIGEIGMLKSSEEIKIYYVSIPAHKFMYIKNYESAGYFDFWEKQEAVPGADCNTICGLLDSIKGKLDGEDGVIGSFSGQIMGYLHEADGRVPECYGVRLPTEYGGPVPSPMLCVDVPEGEYIVFEHGPFDYEDAGASVGAQVDEAVKSFRFDETAYELDDTAGRIGYFFHDPASFHKIVRPVKKK